MTSGMFDVDHVLTFYNMHLNKNEVPSFLSFTKA